MVGEPAFTVAEQFVHFVIAYPVVLVVVEDRDQDIKMGQQLVEAQSAVELHVEILAVAPLGEFVIKRIFVRPNRVAQRFEQASKELFPTATRNNGKGCFQLDGCTREFWALLAPSGHRTAEDICDDHAEER